MSEQSYGSHLSSRVQKIDATRTLKFFGQQATNHSADTLKHTNEYGKPKSGSLTEMRGLKASIHVYSDVLQLCEMIAIEGQSYNDEDYRMILFGDLFQLYTTINNKLVGILLRGRKHAYIQFEGEMLFQRRDDETPIFLTDTIENIRNDILQKQNDIRKQIVDNPVATTLL